MLCTVLGVTCDAVLPAGCYACRCVDLHDLFCLFCWLIWWFRCFLCFGGLAIVVGYVDWGLLFIVVCFACGVRFLLVNWIGLLLWWFFRCLYYYFNSVGLFLCILLWVIVVLLNCSVWWFVLLVVLLIFVCYFSCVRLLVIWLVLLDCLSVICGVFGLGCMWWFVLYVLFAVYLFR